MTFSSEEKIDGLCMITERDALSLKKIASYSLPAISAMMCREYRYGLYQLKMRQLPRMIREIERSVRHQKTNENAAGIVRTSALIRLDLQGQAGSKAVAVSIFRKRMPAYLVARKRDVILLFLLSKLPRVWQ